jgi:hypothetical protein
VVITWYSVAGATEEYNGTSWTASKFKYSKNLLGSAGTQTAALAFGGKNLLIYSSNRRIRWKFLDNSKF